jgi:hypothetical protein
MYFLQDRSSSLIGIGLGGGTQLAFGMQPVVEVPTVAAAAFEKELVRALRDDR